jgi:hypothetical protein
VCMEPRHDAALYDPVRKVWSSTNASNSSTELEQALTLVR